MSLSGNFSYVFIPADTSLPLELRTGDKSGGLSDDDLVKQAKEYFHEQSGGAGRAAALAAMDTYSVEERKTIAESVRSQMIAANPNAASQINQMQDDALLELVKATESSTSCDITALTVPTKTNNYMAVSMYGADNTQGMPSNPRATALLEACGHTRGVLGNVFVGRCRDKEDTDVWERVDFVLEDAVPEAPWCAVAKSKGGGGGHGQGGSPASLSGVMSQAFQNNTSGGGNSLQQGVADGYTWLQTNEEVELKFSVAPGTKAKYVKVAFSRTNLKVTVAGQTLVNGQTGGTVDVGDCTYTIQDEKQTGRELCVTLGKKDVGSTWPFAVQSK